MRKYGRTAQNPAGNSQSAICVPQALRGKGKFDKRGIISQFRRRAGSTAAKLLEPPKLPLSSQPLVVTIPPHLCGQPFAVPFVLFLLFAARTGYRAVPCLGRYVGWSILVAACCAGCGRVVFTPAQQQAVKLSPEQQQTVLAQSQQWQQQAGRLDRDNQDLESLLAQSRQQIQLLNDEVRATRGQLKTSTEQLAASRSTNQSLQKRTEALAASVQRRTGAEIRPNNSLVRDLAISHMPGVMVRPDGDLVRIELASDRLFQPASGRLTSGANTLLRSVAAELARQYPRQIIGVEGHTDSSLVRTSRHGSSLHLSIAQATAVYDKLTSEVGMSAEQLFVIGHGSNHPVVSNATEAGKSRNRRIELVVYPETVRRR